MRAFSFTSLAACLLLASGCVVVSGGGGGGGGLGSGSLTVNWTFGNTSCTTAGVGSIEIQGKGELDGDSFDKTVPCNSSYAQGINIGNLSVENYDVMITGYDTTGQVTLYQMAAPKPLAIQAGSNTYSIDVPSVTGSLTIQAGNFGSYASCSAAQIPTIQVTLQDGSGNTLDSQSYSCGGAGATWTQLSPGTYGVIVQGEDSTGLAYYVGSQQVDVQTGANSYSVDLTDNTGDLTLDWTFGGSGVCGSVVKVQVVLTDPNGNTYDSSTYTCQDNGGVQYTGVPAGTYSVQMQGLDASQQVIYQGTNNNINVTVGGSPTYVVDMN